MATTVKEQLHMNAVTGTTDEYSGEAARNLDDVLRLARKVVDDHWSNDAGNVDRQRVRDLEAALKKVGA